MGTVAVLLATYNGKKYIAEQLESLLAQTYQDFVCYIHDDGSKDGTFQICEEYAARIPEKFIVLEYPSMGSAKNNFISMLRYAREEYLMFCDQDDIWLPTKIEKTLKCMKKIELPNKSALVFSDLKIVQSDLSVIAESYIKYTKKDVDKTTWRSLLPKGFMPGCTFMLNRQLVNEIVENSRVNYEKISMHDWWAVLVNAVLDGVLGYVKEPLMLYRQHDTNCVGIKRKTFVQAVTDNARSFLSGQYAKKKNSLIQNYRNQAEQLLTYDAIDKEKRDFIQRFVNINSKNKMYRIGFYIKYFHHIEGIWRMILWV